MRKKRFLAVIMVATLALGSTVTASASTISSQDIKVDPATGHVKGNGTFEGALNEEIFVVEVPTQATGDKTLDFIMDPQNLIERTDGAKYATSNTNMNNRHGISTDNIDYGTLYFANTSSNGTVSQLSSSSNALKIKNKSTMDVTVGLTAKVTKLGNVALSTNDQLSGNTAPSLYLAMVGEDLSGNNTNTGVISSGDGAHISTTVSGCDSQYNVSVNSANEYEYKLSSNSVNFAGYSFKLTGSTGGGQYADWAAVEKAMETETPEVEITWNIVPYVAPVAPSITGATTFAKRDDGSGILVDISLGAGEAAAKGIKSITFAPVAGGDSSTLATTNYEIVNGQLKIKGSHVGNISASRVYTITFDDAASTTATFTITVTP